MACNNTGYFTNEFAEKWGIVDYDWSNIKYGWAEAVPQDCQHKLQIQASQTKAASKASGKTGNNVTKVFVYRNMVKALPWYSRVCTREIGRPTIQRLLLKVQVQCFFFWQV